MKICDEHGRMIRTTLRQAGLGDLIPDAERTPVFNAEGSMVSHYTVGSLRLGGIAMLETDEASGGSSCPVCEMVRHLSMDAQEDMTRVAGEIKTHCIAKGFTAAS